MWYDLAGSSHPTELNTGSSYLFTITVQGTTTPAMLREELASAGWSVVSVHPGYVTGLVRSFQVLAVWAQPAATVSNPSYAQVLVWVPGTGESSTPPTPWAVPAPVSTGSLVGSVVFGGLVGFAGYVLFARG